MSIYNELNDVNLDLSKFEEVSLSKHEQKRILKQVKRKISFSKPKQKWLRVGITAMAVCALSIFLAINSGAIASIPFVGEVIEKYINANENLDYSSYKTAIGETAENKLGNLTLHEVLIDDQQLFLSATFKPSEHVDFDYQTYITPKVKINGEVYTVTTGGQSIELNNKKFTIFNDIDLSKAIDSENVQIEISYDTWNFDTVIDQPWTFNVEVSQAQLLKEKKVFEMNKTITLVNGEMVTIKKVVTTPISITVYYDLSQSTSEDILFKIQSEDGKLQSFSTAATTNDNDASYVRFNGLKLKANKYYLVAYDSEDNRLNESPIPIN